VVEPTAKGVVQTENLSDGGLRSHIKIVDAQVFMSRDLLMVKERHFGCEVD
jgi:hypothetical protein